MPGRISPHKAMQQQVSALNNLLYIYSIFTICYILMFCTRYCFYSQYGQEESQSILSVYMACEFCINIDLEKYESLIL